MQQKYETNIEAILSELDFSSEESLNTLNVYLSNSAENLSLKQYRNLRILIDSKYRNKVANAVRAGKISRKSANKVGRDFTDYIREQHANLLDNDWENTIIKQEDSSYSPNISREKLNNKQYKEKWKAKDNELYKLERGLWGKEKLLEEEERNLIDEMPTEGYSIFKLKTISRMIPRTAYKSKLKNILRKFRAAA